MATQPSGFVIYDGPSLLTGAPIVAIATVKSTNRKTGDMLQTWVLLQDRDPIAGNRSGADIAICGKCSKRGNARPEATTGLASERECYVDLARAPLGVWNAWKRGRYPKLVGHAAIAAIGKGRKVRLGAYGDPAAIPAYVNESLIAECAGHTAYSHQSAWGGRTSGFAPESMMVSADTLSAASEAWARSWRTFRVVGSVDELVKGREVLCPASEEAGSDAVRELPAVWRGERCGEEHCDCGARQRRQVPRCQLTRERSEEMSKFAKTYNADGVEIVTREEWGRARRHGYAQIWDGRRFMLRLDPETGATVYRIVEVR